MSYVYLLTSRKDGGFYIGFSKNLKSRFKEHMEGKVKATKQRRPLDLFY